MRKGGEEVKYNWTIELLQNHLNWFEKDKILHEEQKELKAVIKMLKEKPEEKTK